MEAGVCPWKAIAEEDLDGEHCQDLVTNICLGEGRIGGFWSEKPFPVVLQLSVRFQHLDILPRT